MYERGMTPTSRTRRLAQDHEPFGTDGGGPMFVLHQAIDACSLNLELVRCGACVQVYVPTKTGVGVSPTAAQAHAHSVCSMDAT